MNLAWRIVRKLVPVSAVRRALDGLEGEHGTPRAEREELRRRLDRLERYVLGALPAADGLPLPPAGLMHKVAGTDEIAWFLSAGRMGADSIREVLLSAGVRIEELGAVLDFGCGCGRVFRWWRDLRGPRLHGTDYNPELVDWCRGNLPFGEFLRNRLAPPTEYADGSFDLVYALSVLTHLPEEGQHAWMAEFSRIVKPGGLLLLTLHGERCAAALPPPERERFDRGELVVTPTGEPGSNECGAFHPPAYVRGRLARGFTVVTHVPVGAKGNPPQDVYLFRKA